jgi:hypothetical protein
MPAGGGATRSTMRSPRVGAIPVHDGVESRRRAGATEPARDPARMMALPRNPAIAAISILALGLGIAVTFRPILAGGFFLDDLVRLYDLINFGLPKLLLSQHGGHLLMASNWVYAAFWSLVGLDPRRWFAAVIALHAVNSALLFSTLRRFGCRDLVALTVAAVWGLCPIQAGSLAWMAVFGHVLLGTIVLVWLRDLATVAGRGVPIGRWRLRVWWALGLLAATSFGIGLGLVGSLPFATVCLLYGAPNRGRVAVALGGLLVFVPMLYCVQYALYERMYPVAPFMVPTVTWPHDLKSIVARGVVFIWSLGDFVIYGLGVLLLGAIPSSMAPPDAFGRTVQLAWLIPPAATLTILAAWGLTAAPSTRRWQAFGVALLAFGGYASVAIIVLDRIAPLVRLGVSRSTAIAMQTMTERYHYVPTALLAILFALAAEAAAARERQARYVTLGLFGILIWLSLRAHWDQAMIMRFVTPHQLGSETRRLESDVTHSVGAEVTYLGNDPGSVFLPHTAQFPGRAALCVITHPDGVVQGRTVRFVEHDADVLAAIRAQGETPVSRLVLSPAEIPTK